jgi:hypothetical protein
MNGSLYQLSEIKQARMASQVHQLGVQSWTANNLCVESYHHEVEYYTTRWDALCPYIDVNEEMLAQAPRPFVVYAIPPDSAYGVQINDKYGLVDTASEAFWNDERRIRKFREFDKQYRDFTYTERVIAGCDLSFDDMIEMGGDHFEKYFIDDREVEGFVDYVRELDVLVLQVHAPDGDLVFTDVSIVLPKYNQLYGSFCQWNRAYKNRSPGNYACLMATRWAAKNGLRYYNLGPVDDYGYKALFVTDFEPIYALALVDPEHPLATLEDSPLKIDFQPQDLNRIAREPADNQATTVAAHAVA